MTIDASFNRRLHKVVRNHERMRTNGVVHKVGRDGLIRSRPRLIRPRFPLKGTVIVLAFLIAFKSLLLAQMGPNNYDLKVQSLRSGNLVEQAGAVIMQQDPLTVALGIYMSRYFFQR